MGKIIVAMSVSLDGFIEGPEHDISWHRVDDELHEHFNEQLRGMAAFLCGRRTYELMETFWPNADQDPASTAPMRAFAPIWRDTPKIVYSRTLSLVGGNATLVPDVDPDDVRELKQHAAGDLSLGGAELAATFQRLGLVDEYHLYVNPVALGRGTPLFSAKVDLVPVGTHTFGNGVVLLRYRA
jgi:dihydrofolate reductase